MPDYIHPGAVFWIDGYLINTVQPLSSQPVFFVLQMYDFYWFWPRWTFFSEAGGGQIDYTQLDIPLGATQVSVIPRLTWPNTGNDTVTALYLYGAILNQDLNSVLGCMAVSHWGYGPSTATSWE